MKLKKSCSTSVLLLYSSVLCAQITISEFSKDHLDDWQEKSFKGHTHYRIVSENGTSVLEGVSNASASILFKEVPVDLTKTPFINWFWKLRKKIQADYIETEKFGDDFAARIYVVYKHGFLPWNTLAINYIWASTQTTGSAWQSPYTNNDMMVAVKTKSADVNQWQHVKRDVMADFNLESSVGRV